VFSFPLSFLLARAEVELALAGCRNESGRDGQRH